MTLTEKKRLHMMRLSDENGIISALAFDQRGALRKLMKPYCESEPSEFAMQQIKTIVAQELSPYASSMLLDPEYGLNAAKALAHNTGLLLAYEKTGYDTNSSDRLCDSLEGWSVRRLIEHGADAVKFLLYYDADGNPETNRKKQAYIERVGAECTAADIPFFLEILAYDENGLDVLSREYAKLKPRKVIEAMKTFSLPRYGIDVLKVEVPVNMNFVEGFSDNEPVYSRHEAAQWFLVQNAAVSLPYIYLSAGVSAKLFRETLLFAKDAGAQFSGVLCGRATWADSVKPYMENGEQAARAWLKEEGAANIKALNEVLAKTAVPWTEKIR